MAGDDLKAFADEMYPSMRGGDSETAASPAQPAAAAPAKGGSAAEERESELDDLYPASRNQMSRGEAKPPPSADLDDPRAWERMVRADPEIGGAALQQHVASASAVLREFHDERLVEALDRYGWGSHPELIRLLSRVGSALKKARGAGGGR